MNRWMTISAAVASIGGLLVLLGVAAASGPVPAPSTQAVGRLCSTDARGYCTVKHDLGVIPEAVELTPVIPVDATPFALSVVSGRVTATTVTVRAVRIPDGRPMVGTIRFSMVVSGSAAPPTTPTTTTAPTSTTTFTTTTTATTTTSTTAATSTTTSPTAPPTAFPDAATTGVPPGTALTVVTGSLNITTANTVIDGKDIRGCVEVHAPGVVLRNSKVSCSDPYVVFSHTDGGLLVENSEIDCQNTSHTAVGDTNITVRRSNIHGCENGFDVDGDFTVADSYVHDLFNSSVSHTDGAQLTDIAQNVTFRHNTIYANSGTSAIISPSTSISNVLIEGNLLAGGAYTLYCRQHGSGSNYRVINNHFSTIFYPSVGAYGPWTDCADEAQVTGNVYHETGRPVPL